MKTALSFSPGWAELQRQAAREKRWHDLQVTIFLLATVATAVAGLVGGVP